MNFHYPRYQELPDQLIFIDEMVDLVNEVHACIPVAAKNGKLRFTRSMASNYMKHGLTPPAVGKKYGRDHICLVLFAATVKLVSNAEGTIALAKEMFASGDFEKTQDMLAEAFEAQMNAAFGQVEELASEGDVSSGREEALAATIALAVAAKACAYLLVSRE